MKGRLVLYEKEKKGDGYRSNGLESNKSEYDKTQQGIRVQWEEK